MAHEILYLPTCVVTLTIIYASIYVTSEVLSTVYFVNKVPLST